MHEQDDNVSYWQHLPSPLPSPHKSGKRVFVGHTPQGGGSVMDGEHIVCIDTYCFGGGFLTAFEIETNEVIQCDYHGHLRRTSRLNLSGPLVWVCKSVWSAAKATLASTPAAEQTPLKKASPTVTMPGKTAES
jgi:serine/threonine protein phosphatase 1